jgi:hypothetical protein
VSFTPHSLSTNILKIETFSSKQKPKQCQSSAPLDASFFSVPVKLSPGHWQATVEYQEKQGSLENDTAWWAML